MASVSDVKDILEIDTAQPSTSTDRGVLNKIFNSGQTKKKTAAPAFKRPEGMHRELYALLYSDNKDVPPLLPTESPGRLGGYKNVKAKLGLKAVRSWLWKPFQNPARKDGLALSHWVKEDAVDATYPFAKFNKVLDSFDYTDAEYERRLKSPKWTREQTDHLMELCKRFDLRFIVIHDRWERDRFPDFLPTVEDMKERYYDAYNQIAKLRAEVGQEPKLLHFDASHERRRKKQLELLYNRTPEQIAEEQYLMAELKKIEARRKERERKAQDLQKLISAADSDRPGSALASSKRKQGRPDGSSADVGLASGGIKWPEVKGAGAGLRSQRMKLPGSVGLRKVKAVDALLEELKLGRWGQGHQVVGGEGCGGGSALPMHETPRQRGAAQGQGRRRPAGGAQTG